MLEYITVSINCFQNAWYSSIVSSVAELGSEPPSDDLLKGR